MASLMFIRLIALFALTNAAKIDVKLKDDGCATYDNCGVADFFRMCSCKEDCSEYGTCCLDSPGFDSMSAENKKFDCNFENVVTPAFAIKTCADDFSANTKLISACQDAFNNKANLVDNLLVSSNMSSNSYWNWNCAVCNHEDPSNILHWSVQVSCPSERKIIDENYIRKNLVYKAQVDSWGLDDKEGFIPCSVNFLQPSSLVGKLKYCAPNMISNCPSSFKDEDTVRKCDYYYGERKQRGKNIYFKNAHCALCNGVSLNNLECFGRNYRPFGLVSGTNMVKVVFQSGEWVGETIANKYKCSGQLAYSPFTHDCRSFTIPTYHPLTNGTDRSHVQFYFLAFIFAFIFLFVNKVF